MQVLFIGSGDIRNALVTVAKLSDAYPKINIHMSNNDVEMNDDAGFTVARY